LHSRVHVCDEIGDLLVALTKCPNAPILIVAEIHGAIHVLIHGVISEPEVVPVLLVRRQELADRQDPVRAAPLALAMMIVAVIHVEIPVVVTEIGPRVASSVTVPVAIVIGLLVVTDLIHVAILVVAIVQPEIVGPVVIVGRVVNMGIVRFVVMTVLILVVAIVIVHPAVILAIVIVHPVVISAIVIVPLVVISVIDRALTAVRVVNMAIGRVVIVVRAVNMATDRFVVMTVLILVVAIVIVRPVVTMEIDPAVIVTVHPAVNSVIDRLVAMIQVLIHVAATEIVLLVAMALVLDVRQAHVVMTVGTVVAAVGRVVKTSLLVDLRTKPNVVVKPCAHVVAVKCVKTANRLRCHVKPRPGLTKAELKMKFAMPPKVQCAERSHRDALCRRDQKMKTN
jgi:hypothetical protein